MRINDIIMILVAVVLIGLEVFTLFRNRKEDDEYGQEFNERDLSS